MKRDVLIRLLAVTAAALVFTRTAAADDAPRAEPPPKAAAAAAAAPQPAAPPPSAPAPPPAPAAPSGERSAERVPAAVPEQPAEARGAAATRKTLKQLGDLLDRDWKSRPEWAEMAIAILKEQNMGMGTGWWHPSSKRYDWDWLRKRLDTNGDGRVEPAEMAATAPGSESLFARLDTDRDGVLTASDFGDSGRGGSPIARMVSMLFAKLDKDSNGRVSTDELADFFVAADRGGFGYLTPEDLRMALEEPAPRPGEARADMPAPEQMLEMLFTGQLGALEPGPQLGDQAPDFTLRTHDGAREVRLSELRGKPVVLVFGSFT